MACTSQNRLNTASSSSESINLGRINVHFPPEKFKKLCKEQQQWRKKKPQQQQTLSNRLERGVGRLEAETESSWDEGGARGKNLHTE